MRPFAKKKTPAKRSPLKSEPLRNPGESLVEERDRLFENEFAANYFMGAMLAIYSISELLFAIFDYRPPLLVMILVPGGFALYCGFRLWRVLPVLKQLRLGIRGEKAVGQFLDDLRSIGYSIFHDIVSPHGNIDHALVGPGGVFAIETKTVSKPTDRDAVVSYDGTKIRVDGMVPERDPIPQTLAAANELAQIIERGTQRRPFVRPVVLYPGRFVEKQPKGVAVWVLAPRAFPAFLQHEPQVLSDVEIAGIHNAIGAHIRSTAASQ
jgi:hypothetical protein